MRFSPDQTDKQKYTLIRALLLSFAGERDDAIGFTIKIGEKFGLRLDWHPVIDVLDSMTRTLVDVDDRGLWQAREIESVNGRMKYEIKK